MGRSKNSSAATGMAARADHEQLRHVEVERTLDDERDRPALDRLAGEVVAVDRLPGRAEEERAGRTSRVS